MLSSMHPTHWRCVVGEFVVKKSEFFLFCKLSGNEVRPIKIAYSCFRLHEDYFSYPIENNFIF